MKVFVYRNLRKNCYSVKALEGPNKGKVIAHCKALILTDCKLKVGASGRERVRLTGHKTVHAGIVGSWDEQEHIGLPDDCKENVYYNPKITDQFTSTLTGEHVFGADKVYLGLTSVFIKSQNNAKAC